MPEAPGIVYFCTTMKMTDNAVPHGMRYRDYAAFLREHFDGKVQKLSVDAGLGCPNRDGTIGWGGCCYCNNLSFVPSYCSASDSVAVQLEKGRRFFGRKYPEMRYLAYFQAHTNTYAPLPVLQRLYEEALGVEGVDGLVIGTRPDCVSDELLDYLASLARYSHIMMEYGVESVDDGQLRFLNREHTFAEACSAIQRTAERGIFTTAHLILGLPGDTIPSMLSQPSLLSGLPLDVLKLHQLQIVRNTPLALLYDKQPPMFSSLFHTPEAYASLLCEYLRRLRPDMAVARFTAQSPPEMLVAPMWGMKNYEFVDLLKRKLREAGARQGDLYVGRP